MKLISKRAVVCLVTGASAVGALGFGAVGTGAATPLAGRVEVHTDHRDQREGPEVHPIDVKVPRACVYENGFQLFGRPVRGTGYPGVCASA